MFHKNYELIPEFKEYIPLLLFSRLNCKGYNYTEFVTTTTRKRMYHTPVKHIDVPYTFNFKGKDGYSTFLAISYAITDLEYTISRYIRNGRKNKCQNDVLSIIEIWKDLDFTKFETFDSVVEHIRNKVCVNR